MHGHTHTSGSMSKDACRSMCMRDCGSAQTDISNESMGVYRSTCPYISTKSTSVHRVTSTENSAVKTVVHGRKNAYNKYGKYKTIWDIGTDIAGKVRKESAILIPYTRVFS